MYGADDLTGFEFLAYKDPPPPYSSPPGTLSRHYDPPPYETAARMAAASQYNVQDVDGVYVSGASVSSPASVENVSECESQVDTHIRQTRV